MGRAARLKRERKVVAIATDTVKQSPVIQLQNPVADSYAQFVIGNAHTWEAQAHDELIRKDPVTAASLEPYWGLTALLESRFQDRAAFDAWQRFRAAVDDLDESFVVKEGSAKGQHVVICGAGPSLAEEAAEWIPQADQVWGCNSALPWLVKNGYKATHGLTVDQTPEMVVEWMTAPDVEYLLATTAHPHLTQHLVTNGRRIRWFHNFVGIAHDPVQWPDQNGMMQWLSYEDWLYMTLFPGTIRAGSGLNTVTRAIDVAVCMGFDKITVLGADCAMRTTGKMPDNIIPGTHQHTEWLKANTVLHADGGHALASNQTALTLGAEIDSGTPDDTVRPGHGRWWESKIDLLISARWLLKMEKHYKGRVNVVGDTYVAAIRGKNKAFLERLPAMIDTNGRPIEIVMGDD